MRKFWDQSKTINVRIAILLGVFFLHTAQSAGQNNSGAAAAAVAGAAVTAAAIAISQEDIRERIEYQANNFILSNLSDGRYELKVLDLDGKKSSDAGNQRLVAFEYSSLNINGEVVEKKVIFMHGSPGWIRPTGLRVEGIKYSVWDRSRWNDLVISTVNEISMLDMSTLQDSLGIDSNSVPVFKKDYAGACKKGNVKYSFEVPSMSGYSGNECYTYFDTYPMDMSKLKIGPRGLSPKGKTATYIFPFKSMSGDEYLVFDFDEEFKVFWNEGAIGLFDKHEGRAILIERSLVAKIGDYFEQL